MDQMLKRISMAAVLGMALSACGRPAETAPAAEPAKITRYPIPNSSFPIALAVSVPAGKELVFVSGQTPDPANPDATQYSAEYWGDTKAQAASVLKHIEDALKTAGLGMGDVVKMNAFLVGDPAKEGKMDFAGFMEAYTQYFGTPAQGNLPARTTVQIAALGRPGMLVEIDVIAVRP